jgi:hypothetical protein
VWFGDPWPSAELRAPVCEDDAERAPTPVGQRCTLCRENIEDGDRGLLEGSGWVHVECANRAVLGNHLHLRGECSRIGECAEKSDLTYRQEALEVWRMLHATDSFG